MTMPPPSNDPLSELEAQIAAARIMPAAPGFETSTGDPLVHLRETIARGLAEQLSAPTSPASPSGPTSVSPPGPLAANRAADGSGEAALGRAVLAMVADEPLAAPARQQAVRLLAEALERPTPAALAEVLRLLVTGQIRPD
ncbi:MAG: hypothetical protein H0U74_01050 [Bradymonadaceae bacterium]|nr:hypothetical protein [Lujinxingiaceae bacterium]